jgi:hypothetical protein
VVASTVHLLSAVPGKVGLQVPLAAPVFAAEQAMQDPVQVLPQQKPSTQVRPDAHWAVAEHVPPCVVPAAQSFPAALQPYVQGVVEGLQTPLPSHWFTVFIFVDELHDGLAPQAMPAPFGLQVALALQVPVWHSPEQRASAVFTALAAHVPRPFRLHAMQVPHEEVAQQTPSTQLPLAQSVPVPQRAPWIFFEPQLVASAHAVEFGQALVAAVQAWVASHALVVRVEPEHESVAQDVPVVLYRQAPLPSQVPSSPQGGLAVHVLWPPWPATTARHCPSAAPVPVCLLRASVHAEQPEHALSQQTPSATTPDLHS